LEENASDAVQATFRILSGMAAEDRLVFSLRYVSGLDLLEMAEACEMSLSTLKRRLSRAEQRFYSEARRDDTLRAWTRGDES
jgi:RNA polymerase sigma-70 factor, ECF subfamily